MENAEISKVFNEIATLLEIQDANPFRIRSYRRSAQIIADLPFSAAQSVQEDEKRLKEVSGIGAGTLSKIKEIVATGDCEEHKKLLSKMPPGLLEMRKLRNVGPAKVRQIWEDLGVTTIDDLEKAARNEALRSLSGFGKKTEEKILEAIRFYREKRGRVRIDLALSTAEKLLSYLKEAGVISKGEIAGSLRRRRETIGDLDLLVTSKSPQAVGQSLLDHEDVNELINSGDTKITVGLSDEMQCDVRILEPDTFGAGWQYFTGSKEHNVVLREMARRKGFSISEYGIFSIDDDKRLAGEEESEIYEMLGLALIPPELRENRGEIEAAAKGELPELIQLEDLRGELHNHTPDSDGRNTLEEMVQEANRRGHEYFAVTDHSRGLAMVEGLDEEGVEQQIEQIREHNAQVPNLEILSGIEVEILEDGSLDLPDQILAKLDVVIASVHSHMNLTQGEMTRRLIRAVENPHVSLVGHPTGRILFKRDAYPVDLEEVITACSRNRVCLEINAHPKRLDLNDVNCRMARDMGALLSINSDCHSTRAFAMTRFGVYTARRGWLSAEDVINTYPLKRLKRVLSKEEYR